MELKWILRVLKPLGYGRRVPTEENCKPPVMYARPGVLFLFMSGKRQIIYLFLLKTFCAQASCQNNGTRQSGFTRKRYRCLCASGFTGHDCEKGNTCVIEMNFWFYPRGSISSEGSRFRISRTYDTYWIWPIVGEKKDGSTSPIFMLFFSTLVKRLVYDEQQRIQATFLRFWMPLSLLETIPSLWSCRLTPG